MDTPVQILCLDGLFQNMKEGVALCELVYDAAGKPVEYRIVDVNPAYCRHTGIPGDRFSYGPPPWCGPSPVPGHFRERGTHR